MSLLLAAGADINLADAYEQTPLIYSVRQNTPSVIIGFLLNSGTTLNATYLHGDTLPQLCIDEVQYAPELLRAIKLMGDEAPPRHVMVERFTEESALA